MFMGEYNHTIDEKGRMIIPSKFRDALGASFVITRGMDGCIYAYPDEEWEKFEEKLSSLPQTVNKDARKFARYFLSGAAMVELDKQGRILIPQNLREHADLKKDVVVAGVLGRVEIWSRERWIAYNEYDDVEILASKMDEYGFNL